ncbi:DUF4145 domain-containing protein [Pseudomonas laurylsulfatiphila]|uniref:DUF4145 domain-containing protein n=1 Tax=Pseudomonas laurylsulfatiphila TaxID=2011015 RepID=UPI00215E489D|nr:DUF4145 domain-containing protein [Pseudomonas laurylsulfatiphila]UVM07025.1 DUF4145 domain-containing protein [Pseudomonas laurylsulfatiphila]
MNKGVLKGAFTQGAMFEYKCPHCYNGLLRLSGEFNSKETELSKSQIDEEWWTPENIALVCSCTLKCTTCHELVFMVGNGVVEQEHDVDERGEWKTAWTSYFSPTFFHPPLQLIDYPSKAPKEMVSHLSVACALYFTSPASCCNSIRAAAELVLSELGVAVKEGDKWISFGNRINLLPEDQKSTKELFNAIRWIGNHGSHPGNEIEFEDALHALEIMEFLLEEVYGERKQALKELAAAINDRKGPVGRLHKLGMG